MKLRAISISEANSYIKRILTNDPILYNLKVKGEISNFKVHSSKNVYFSLKDEHSKINCVMFKNNYNPSIKLEDGVKVIANGYISVYERDGSYQLYVNSIEVDGIGNLYIEFNKLKDKLEKEGLFDKKYKKTIPYMPQSIGVITSPTGAVIKDIINVITRRYPKVNIKLYPVAVQGPKSASSICEGIKFFNTNNNVDVIILGRGGGSIEELWSFNEEIVARTIFESNIPLISAVGHETDFTIADFVSDMRAPTPSAGAEIATPSLKDILYKLENIKTRINKSTKNTIDKDRYKLDNIKNNIVNKFSNYVVKDKIIQLDKIYDKITSSMDSKLKIKREKLNNIGSLLHNLSPLATMTRGYCITQRDGIVIKNANDLNKDDSVDVVFNDGQIICNVEKIITNEG
jgi:exodeoxyribonuclease VII large subunit